MHSYKKVLIVSVMLAFVASVGAAAVSAQTGDSVTAPVVGATYKTPTTLVLWPSSQSIKTRPCDNTQMNTVWLRTGAVGLQRQKVDIYERVGDGYPWIKKYTATTSWGTSSKVGMCGFSDVFCGFTQPLVREYRVVYLGTNTYAAATSNIVKIKYENTKTTPYQTTLYAYAPKQVVPHGTTNTMWVKLLNGQTPLTGKYVYVWKWSGGKWVIVSRIITRTGTQAGWALADYRLNSAGSGLYQFTFFGSSPYDRSTSNSVQLIWT